MVLPRLVHYPKCPPETPEEANEKDCSHELQEANFDSVTVDVLLLLAAGSEDGASARQDDVEDYDEVGCAGCLLVVEAVVEAENGYGFFTAAGFVLQLVVWVEGARFFSIVFEVLDIVFCEARV